MSAHSTAAKAASGLSSARRTLEGVRGGHAAGFLQQAVCSNNCPTRLTSRPGPVTSTRCWVVPGNRWFTYEVCHVNERKRSFPERGRDGGWHCDWLQCRERGIQLGQRRHRGLLSHSRVGLLVPGFHNAV